MNLILTGFAVSNVFNGIQELGTSGEEKVHDMYNHVPIIYFVGGCLLIFNVVAL